MIFILQLGKIEKQPALLVQLPQSVVSQVTHEVLQFVKDLSNYEDRTVHKNEQKPIDFEVDNDKRPTMVKPNELKKRVEKRKQLEKRLDENTIQMKRLKSN